MPPRKPCASTARATRSTQRKTRAELDIKSEERDSPDPIGSTPVPGPSHSSDLGDIFASSSRARTRLSHRSSPASSIHAPSSESRPGREAGTKAKTRLRSGRRSKGLKEVAVLGEGDLIVPSDEDEYEEWVEGKRGESSKMAQERWERERDPIRSHGQSRGMDAEVSLVNGSGMGFETDASGGRAIARSKRIAGLCTPLLTAQSSGSSSITTAGVTTRKWRHVGLYIIDRSYVTTEQCRRPILDIG